MDKYSNMVNTTIPYAWDDSISLYEFLGKVISKLNEVVDEVNLKLPDDFETTFYERFREYTRDEMQRILDSGEFADILDSMVVEFSPIKQEVIDARDGEVSLGAKIRSVDAQLVQTATQTTVDNNANLYWMPPKQPAARKDTDDDYFINIWSGTSDYYIDEYFEPLRADFSDYISRETIGKDESGTYDVYRYIYTPKSFNKTIVLTSCLHGNELMPMVTMLRFLHHLLYEWDKYPQLSYIRNHVRIVYIPFVNPWGVSQNPRTRHNSNGVDLNRNFDYNWETFASPPNPGDFGYKGEQPFSEVESRYIRDTLNSYTDIVSYLDMHNYGEPSADFIYFTATKATNRPIFEKLVVYLSKDIVSPEIITAEREHPTAYAYAWNVLNIPSANPEFPDGRFGNVKYDAIEVTKSLEWFSNLILQHVSDVNYKVDEPFVIENTWARGESFITLENTLSEISELSFEFEVPCDGIVTYDVDVVISKADSSSSYYLRPVIGQSGTIFPYTQYSGGNNEVYINGDIADRHSMSARTQIRVLKTDSIHGKVRAGIFMYNTEGVSDLYRYRSRITFIPSDKKQRLQRYRKRDTNENWEEI